MQQLQAASRSHRPSVDTLYRDHAHPLRLWLAARGPRNNLEDVSQAVWSRVVEHYSSKFDGENFRAWLFQIARNYLVDSSRRQKRMPAPDEESMVRPDNRAREPSDILIDREYRQRFRACIENLGEPRKGIVKAKASGMSYDEFVLSMNLTKQQAFQHFFAAKKLLKACMEAKK